MDQEPEFCFEKPHCLPWEGIVATILSSLASVVGSLLIIGTFLGWKDLRTVARMILVFLAIADLFTGLGYIFGAAIYWNYHPHCNNSSGTIITALDSPLYNSLCTAQSFFTTLFPIASFFWTGNLSIYLFIAVGLHKSDFAKKLMVPFHVIAWGIPLVLCIALLSTQRLGSSTGQSNADWCWIKMKNKSSNLTKSDYTEYFMLEFVAGKMWELLIIILSLTLFISVKIMIWRRYKRKEASPSPEPTDSNLSIQFRAVFTKLDQKLLWIPVVFVLVRMWGIIRFLMSVPPLATRTGNNCIYYEALAILQGIGDPGQGWSNALLFVIFNSKLFQRLCPCLYSCGVWCLVWCDSIRCRFKRKERTRMNRHHIKKTMLSSGIVTYDERQALVTDSVVKSSVVYQSTAKEESLKKKSFANPTSPINESNKR